MKKYSRIEFSKIVLSQNFMKNLFNDETSELLFNFFKTNFMDSIFKKSSYIKSELYNILFIKSQKNFYEYYNFNIYKKIKTFSLKYNNHYTMKKHYIGNTIIDLLNKNKSIISYIENTINCISPTDEKIKTNTYVNFLYLQLYLLSKNTTFIICDITRKIDLYNEGLEINQKVTKEQTALDSFELKKSYNETVINILKREINILQNSVKKINTIFSVTSKRGYRKFNNSNIKLPNSIIKYYMPIYGKKLRPYYYKYVISSYKELLDVSIYQIYISGKVICKCSLNSCNKYFISKNRKDEHFCNDICKDKFYKEKHINRDSFNYKNKDIIKQIQDFLSRPKMKNGIKIKQPDRLKELEKFKNSLQSKREVLSDKQLNIWLLQRQTKYLEKFSKKRRYN